MSLTTLHAISWRHAHNKKIHENDKFHEPIEKPHAMPSIPSFLIGFGIFWLFIEAKMHLDSTSSALWPWLIRFTIWSVVTVISINFWREAEAYSDQAFLSAGTLGMLAGYAMHMTKKFRRIRKV